MQNYILVLLLFITTINAQQRNDTLTNVSIDTLRSSPNTSKSQFGYKQLIIPGMLIGYGFVGLNNKWIQSADKEVRNGFKNNTHTSIDQFTLYVPAATVYALNAIGVKGKHNFKDRTVIFASATLISNITVKYLKSATHVTRPNGLVDNSFPSGHTTAAFVGAEFLWQEYKDVSIWYGVGGFTVAGATGVMRLINDRHWVSDIIAGAGIGILSTKAAYWLHPFVNRILFGREEKKILQCFYHFIMETKPGGVL
ncbi:phosphatase PAP2 family protein [Flavobacterium sp. NRK1]|uniref:phosphatase PAP2 family protein n=1 Tax=Flavobacterium sp. NRK1 TaxID=2954929 RepID=UPI00209377E0|nr:phosphatase PAP2 family protein [Flavobacterium sp. NRK1]MCO6149589.1 phosphatase PAP2 family protein [Flavobacterium sp. NRK1]